MLWLVNRLCANLCRADDSKLEVSTLFSTYQQACAQTDIEPIPENALSKIIKSLYDIKKGRSQIGEKEYIVILALHSK